MAPSGEVSGFIGIRTLRIVERIEGGSQSIARSTMLMLHEARKTDAILVAVHEIEVAD